jgi:hypothetical protein
MVEVKSVHKKLYTVHQDAGKQKTQTHRGLGPTRYEIS